MKNDLIQSFDNFSKNFKEGEFDKAMKLREQLADMNESQSSIDKVRINTVEAFKKGFSFAEVAKNDFSMEAMEELEIAEKNLNSNLDNVDLFNSFVDTANACKKKLKEKY